MKYLFLFSSFISFSTMAQFQENTEDYGIDHLHGNETLFGGGSAFVDINNDGLDDLYLTNGENTSDKLYLNIGNESFTDISISSGIDEYTKGSTTFGIITGDVDNDGCEDLFITTYDPATPNLLLKGDCDGHFQDISWAARIREKSSSASASFFDFNKDGYLDIYVTNYIRRADFIRDSDNLVIGYTHQCHPNFFYVNQGDGTFNEMAAFYGIDDVGCGLAVSTSDFDLDGDQDIYLVNDFGEWVVPNKLFANVNGESFLDVTDSLSMGLEIYGMGVTSSDFDNDNDIDFYVTNIGKNSLMSQSNNSKFEDISKVLNIDNTLSIDSTNSTSWGSLFVDINNDGWDDIYIANGYIPSAPFLNNSLIDDNKLYVFDPQSNTYVDNSALYNIDNTFIHRGASYSDIDNDGDLDIFSVAATSLNVSDSENGSLLLVNDFSNSNNWLQVDITGTISNKNGFGATLRIYKNGFVQLKQKLSGESHASQNTEIVHFGLSDIIELDSLIINWPSGLVSHFNNVASNNRILITEGSNEYTVIDCTNSAFQCYSHTTPGCTNQSSERYNPFATVDDGSCLDSPNAIFDNNLLIYPNPVEEILNIQFNSHEIVRIEIYSLTGELLLFTNLSNKINTSELSKGTYILSVYANDLEITSRKIFKK